MDTSVVVALTVMALLAGLDPGQAAMLANQPTIGSSPAFFFSFMFVGPSSCSLATGVCTTTIVNTGTNSSYDLRVDGCHMDIITYRDNFTSVYKSLPGTIGGFVASRLIAGDFVNRFPAGDVVTSTCTIPTTLLTVEPSGQPATGFYTMELVNTLGSLPPGKNASVAFAGTWISSPTTVISTSTVILTSTLTNNTTSIITTTSTAVSTATATATTTETTGNGSILGFPDQLLAASAVIFLLVASYLIGRRYPVRR